MSNHKRSTRREIVYKHLRALAHREQRTLKTCSIHDIPAHIPIQEWERDFYSCHHNLDKKSEKRMVSRNNSKTKLVGVKFAKTVLVSHGGATRHGKFPAKFDILNPGVLGVENLEVKRESSMGLAGVAYDEGLPIDRDETTTRAFSMADVPIRVAKAKTKKGKGKARANLKGNDPCPVVGQLTPVMELLDDFELELDDFELDFDSDMFDFQFDNGDDIDSASEFELSMSECEDYGHEEEEDEGDDWEVLMTLVEAPSTFSSCSDALRNGGGGEGVGG